MLTLFDERDISSHYLTYLVNGDDSGLDEFDRDQFDEWMTARELNGLTCDVVGDESSFTRCEVTGLYSDCHTVKFFVMEGNSQ